MPRGTTSKASPRHVRLLTVAGIFLVATIAGASITFALNLRTYALRETERELGNVSIVLAEQTAQSFHALELVQSSIIEHIRAKKIETTASLDQQMGEQNIHHMLADKISGLPQVDAVTIVNANGRLVNFSRYWPIPDIDVSDRDYFKALEGDSGQSVFLSEPVQNRGTGTWTIYLARKIVSSDGRFLGLVLGAMRLQYFRDQFASVALQEKQGSIALFRPDGMLLARYPEQPGTIGHIFPRVGATIATANPTLRIVSDVDWVERIVAARLVRGFPAYVTVSTSATAATANIEHKALQLAASGGVLALAVGLLVFLVFRHTAAEREQARCVLVDQQQKLDAAINNMTQGLVMFEADGRIVLSNDRYAEMYQLAHEAVAPGTDLLALIEARKAANTFSGDAVQYCADVMASVARGGGASCTVTPDGRTIHVINRPMWGGGWVATHEDVTEQRKAEVERDRNRDLLDKVIENVPVMIVVKDADDLKYVLLNKASETRLGLLDGAGLGKCARDVFNEATADRIDAFDRKCLASGKPLSIDEHPIDLPSGTRRLQRSTRVPIFRPDGRPQYLLTVSEDLTDRKAVEQQLQQAVKMEAVGNLTGGIAHDFNNLLMVMIGNLDLLAEDVSDNPHARDKVEIILQSALAGAELTRQMLAFARRQPLNSKVVLVGDLINATARLLGRTLGDDIAVELRIADDLWQVCADESQLQSSLVNIAINARDAMPAGGSLIIEAHNTVVEEDDAAIREHMKPGDYVVISLSDTGVGMPPENLARVFEPFFTTKAHGKGSGLGLSMVYGFAKQSGGHVTIYSELDRGTTIKLYLPRDTSGMVKANRPESEALPLGGGEIVLAVDDNKDVLATVARQLTDLGYSVVTAGSAFSALRLLEGGLAADLLFSDIVMPGGLSGKDLADEALRKYPDLKVLLTSGFTDGFLAHDSRLHSDYELLAKPYRKQDLARAVRRTLGQKATVAA